MRPLVDGLWSPRASYGTLRHFSTKKTGAALATPEFEDACLLLRRFPAQRNFDSAAEVKRQRGKSRRRIVMLAGQIFDCGIDLKIAVEPIAATHIDFLISRCQVA